MARWKSLCIIRMFLTMSPSPRYVPRACIRIHEIVHAHACIYMCTWTILVYCFCIYRCVHAYFPDNLRIYLDTFGYTRAFVYACVCLSICTCVFVFDPCVCLSVHLYLCLTQGAALDAHTFSWYSKHTYIHTFTFVYAYIPMCMHASVYRTVSNVIRCVGCQNSPKIYTRILIYVHIYIRINVSLCKEQGAALVIIRV